LCFELINKKIIKIEQTSDWGKKNLSLSQQKYAATDVLYLHALRKELNTMLMREDRVAIAKACFNFLEHRVKLDLSGWSESDIFRH